MKLAGFVLAVAFVIAAPAAAASAEEAALREIEAAEGRAILARDIPALRQFWAEAMIVNAPNNAVLVGREAVFNLIRTGVIDYTQYDKTIEHVAIDGDAAVVMGAETLRARTGPRAGQIAVRRYTNVYRRSGDAWRLTARHANFVPR